MKQSKAGNNTKANAAELLKKTIKNADGCLVWQGRVNYSGYGQFCIKGTDYRVHRLIALWLIPNPNDKPIVLHSCDNPPCINPDHLRWGTPLENAQDRDSKNRGKMPNNSGSNSANAKLTEAQVYEIKLMQKAGYRGIDIASAFNISQQVISAIKHGTKWRHVILSEE